ncbi:DNA topoisomerase IB [Aquihabitans sp. McL0605]|uniref:DNA topoisomerase IB n=1 Tax=Aquihabitans sp. McL0605 TaxID=3415671 RepID=UPI003CFAC846
MPAIQDPEAAARAAGLRYVDDAAPGITRRRRGKGFSYTGPGGRPVTAAVRERIDVLAIPPAWVDVWICPRDDGHIQATGRDDQGRKQYRYHDGWRTARDADKFAQLASFGVSLAQIRRQVATDLARRDLPKERVLALVVRLLDETLIRVGNPEYAKNESFGLTTLQPRHVEVDGPEITFEFTGKSGAEHEVTVEGRRLSATLQACEELDGQQLFSYRSGDEVHDIGSHDVNDYLRDIAGPDVSARDFRTWGGTVTAVEHLGPQAVPASESEGTSVFLAGIDAAAERLGNTRDVCRASYVHPVVERSFRDGDLREAWRRSRRTRRLTRAERATLRLLVDEAAQV